MPFALLVKQVCDQVTYLETAQFGCALTLTRQVCCRARWRRFTEQALHETARRKGKGTGVKRKEQEVTVKENAPKWNLVKTV